jgi:hypothetical protein
LVIIKRRFRLKVLRKARAAHLKVLRRLKRVPNRTKSIKKCSKN